MPCTPLIFAPTTDPHACALDWALRQRGAQPVWASSLQTAPGMHYTFRVNGNGQHFHDGAAGTDKITSVWNRRLEDPRPRCAEADLGFASWEWKLFQRNVFSLPDAYGDALWVNALPAAQRAENKLHQLATCRRLGIPVPDTVVTTDAREVDALRRRWGRIIFKSFLIHQWENAAQGSLHAVGVTLLDEHSDLPPDAIAVCPGIYQRYIEKAADIRVTCVGDHLFALKLGKGAHDAYVDWRGHARDPELRAEQITLPGAVETKLRALMRELGLVFGCIDLALDRDGTYHFLEVNQAGQFLFVEDLVPGIPMLAAVTTLLETGRADFTLAPDPAITMHAFAASDAMAKLRETIEQTPIHRPLYTLEPL